MQLEKWLAIPFLLNSFVWISQFNTFQLMPCMDVLGWALAEYHDSLVTTRLEKTNSFNVHSPFMRGLISEEVFITLHSDIITSVL